MSYTKILLSSLKEQYERDIFKIKGEFKEKEAIVFEEYRKAINLLQSACPHTNKRDETWEHPHSGRDCGYFVCDECGKQFKE